MFFAITFNFSRNGIGTDLYNITELDKFAINTYSHEITDLKCIIDAIVNGKISKGLMPVCSKCILLYLNGK